MKKFTCLTNNLTNNLSKFRFFTSRFFNGDTISYPIGANKTNPLIALLKAPFSFFLVLLIAVLSNHNVFGQCSRTNCTYIGDPSAPTTSWQTVSGSLPDETTYNRYDFYLYSDMTYYFSLCSADGGAASYDSYLCLYGYGYGCGYTSFLASNDDYCGNASYISYTATQSGWTSLYISGYGSNYGSYTLAYKSAESNTPSTPITSGTTSICSGNSTIISATSTNATSIYWYTGGCGNTFVGTSSPGANFSVSPASTTTYYARGYNVSGFSVSCSSATVTVNPISTAIETQSPASGSTVCAGTTITYTGSGTGTFQRHEYQWGGTGGTWSTYSTGNPATWGSSTGTLYMRSVYKSGVCSEAASSPVVVYVNAVPSVVSVSGAGAYCGSTTITASGGAGGTVYYQGTTSNGTSTATAASSASINTSGTYYFRSRSSTGCWSTQGSAAVTIGDSLPSSDPIITASSDTICYGSSTLLYAPVPGCIIYWYTDSCGGNLLGTGDSITVTPLSATTYYAKAVNGCGSSGCSSITIGVNPVPGPVYISKDSADCSGSNILTASGGTGGTIYWQGANSGGTSTATPSVTQTVTSSGTYYFRAFNGQCWGTQGSITVITSVPGQVTVNGGGTYCNSAVLTATGGANGTIYWQDTIGGGTSTATDTTTRVITASGTYYFRAYNVCGWGTEGSAIVIVVEPPSAVMVSGGGSICSGSSTTLNAVGGTGGTVYWQGTTSSGTSTATPATSQSVTTSGIYYFRAYNANCGWGVQGSATVVVNPLPSNPVITGVPTTICQGSSSTLSAAVTGCNIYWYTGICGGVQTGVGNSVTVSPTATTTYYARAYNVSSTGCWSAGCGSFTVMVNAVPGITTVSGGGTSCGGSVTLTGAGGTGGTIYWQGTTSNGISTGTASTSQTVSTTGTYYFRALNSYGCWGPQGSASVLTSLPATVTVAGGGTYCASNLPLYASGGTGGTIYWQNTTSGGTSTATPTTNRTVSSSGTYYYRAYNGCGWGAQGSATVTINAVPSAVSVAGGGTQCGGSRTITASGGTNGTIYWQGTTSNGTSTTTPAASYSVSSSGTYYFRSRSAAGCWGAQGSAAIAIYSYPSAPSSAAVSPSTVCSGTSTTFTLNYSGGSAGGSGGTLRWYESSCGGTFVGSGNNVQITRTLTSNTTYYCRWESNSCGATSCASDTVTVNTVPSAVSVLGGTTQCGGSVVITASGGTNGTIYWQGTTSNGTSTSNSTNPQSVSSSGTYYFRAYNGCGWGAQGSATVTINPSSGAVTVNGAGTYCNSQTLTATGGTNGTIYWQGTTSGGTSTAEPGTSHTVTSSGTYYFRSYNNCMWGTQGSATVTINPEPGPVTVNSSGTYCGSTTLTATGGTGGTIYWQCTTSGGTSTATPSTSQPVTMSGTYYFRSYNNCEWGTEGFAVVTITAPVFQTITGTTPICFGSSQTWTSTTTGGTWTSSATAFATVGSTTGVVTGVSAGTSRITYSVTTSGGCVNSATKTVTVSALPYAEAGADAIYSGTPVLLGDTANGPGTISWSPASGLNDTTVSQPLASPSVTTTYTLTVNHNGCIATDQVTIYFNPNHTISGKTRYKGRAYNGSPAPNLPYYNPAIYAIDRVIVILKSYPSGVELARDTSDATGNYQFSNVPDGEYTLSWDKYTADTMQWGNDISVTDVAMLKYLIASDTVQDPSRKFTADYLKAANVDNNAYINVADVARIKSKIASPYEAGKNFPKGNWVALTKTVTVSGSDLNLNLETICYGDYNASSSKYRDSLTAWNGSKSLPSEIIVTSDTYIKTSDASYFEIPLRVSAKMDDFSALGLELSYPAKEYRLVSAYMPKGMSKGSSARINPSYEEILADAGDLLVSDHDGVIRVVYATTGHYDVAADDEVLVLGFSSLNDRKRGDLEFRLSGTGVVANQYGQENEDAYFIIPKVFAEGNGAGGMEFTACPNPFSDKVLINYTLPEAGTVKIKMYNALGGMISELVNETQSGGKHTISCLTEELPSGMYSIVLEYMCMNECKSAVLKLIH